MEQPDVSVVMPVWRPHGPWLREAVESVLAENGCSLELLVVDDGNEIPIASLLAQVDDDRLKVIRATHRGECGARNAGMVSARGRFVRFVDSDDVVVGGSTRRLLALSDTGSSVISYGDTVVCDESLQPLRAITTSLEGDVTRDCLLGRFDTRIVSMLFPRAVVEQAGPMDVSFPMNGDWEFVLRALELAPVRRGDFTATLYRRHTSSETGRASLLDGARQRERIIVGYLDRHPEERGAPLEREARSAAVLHTARAYASRGRPLRAIPHLIAGARFGIRPACRAAARIVLDELRARISAFGRGAGRWRRAGTKCL